jgi:hypothetical protein
MPPPWAALAGHPAVIQRDRPPGRIEPRALAIPPPLPSAVLSLTWLLFKVWSARGTGPRTTCTPGRWCAGGRACSRGCQGWMALTRVLPLRRGQVLERNGRLFVRKHRAGRSRNRARSAAIEAGPAPGFLVSCRPALKWRSSLGSPDARVTTAEKLPAPAQSQGTATIGELVSVPAGACRWPRRSRTLEGAHSMNAGALFVALYGPSRRPCLAPTNLGGCAVAVPRWWFPTTGVHKVRTEYLNEQFVA